MKSTWVVLGLLIVVAGCIDKPSLFPNSDPQLRKTKTEFAADAKKRFPYPGAATEDAQGMAEMDVELDKIRVTNQSDAEWRNVDIWVNKSYVVHVPKIEAKGGIRTLEYQMFYNDKGEPLPRNNDKYRVTDIEMHRGGQMYKLRIKLAY